MIVDTHTHIISQDEERYPRKIMAGAGADWTRHMPVTAERMLQSAEEAGIERIVLNQGFTAYAYDNSYACDSALRYPERFAAVAVIDVERDGAGDRARYWVKERGAQGVRLVAGIGTQDPWPEPRRAYDLWKASAELGVPICVIVRPHNIPRVRQLLKDFPGARVALDHMGFPGLASGPPSGDLRALLDMGSLPNLFLKFTTVTMYDIDKGRASARDIFRSLIDHFGANRLMWGSNFPSTHDRSLKAQMDLARERLAFLSAEEQRWVFGESALGLWTALRGPAR